MNEQNEIKTKNSKQIDVSAQAFYKMRKYTPEYKKKKQPPEVFYKKVFLKIPQNLQENISARVSFLMKLQASGYTAEKKIYSM